jgi:predicted AlkP superfamily pyrophosphatase or phosphodiesterase
VDKVIFVVLDGLNAKTAHNHMGFLEHLVEKGIMAAYTIKSEMPAQSRPLYEVLQTGVPAAENGITSNRTVRRSKEQSVFEIAKDNGLKTGAAAYFWVSELYNRAPFQMMEDRIQLDTNALIEHGIFYHEDHYPDSHLIADGDYLIRKKATDYTLIHSMNIDDAGHKFGADSKEYVQAAVRVDAELSQYIWRWMSEGYQIVVTSDHGMNDYHTHNGISDEDRLVPLYLFSDKVIVKDFRKEEAVVPQLEIAPFLCNLLGIPAGDRMQAVQGIFMKRGSGDAAE